MACEQTQDSVRHLADGSHVLAEVVRYGDVDVIPCLVPPKIGDPRDCLQIRRFELRGIHGDDQFTNRRKIGRGLATLDPIQRLATYPIQVNVARGVPWGVGEFLYGEESTTRPCGGEDRPSRTESYKRWQAASRRLV